MKIDKRNADRIKAEELYLESKGKIELVKIAEIISRPPGTVRGWKSKDKWDDKLNGTFQSEVERSNSTNSKKKETESVDEELVEKVMANESLTDKQRMFCVHYIKCFNATKASIKAGYSKDYASEIGYQLLQKTTVKDEIHKLKQHKFNRAMLSEDDLFQVMIDIAFSDVTDYTDFGTEEVPVMNELTGKQAIDDEGNPIFYKRNYLYFNDSGEVDGTLINEISLGKNGVKVKLQDKIRAVQWLSDRMDMLTNYNQEKLQLEKDKLEHIKGKDNQTDKPIEIVIKKKEEKR